MGKFYAVKKGKKPGIYHTWDECSAQVRGYSGAEYKSFASESEALDYINSTIADMNTVTVEADELFTEGILCAYTDGSYTRGNPPKSGYGICFVRDGKVVGHKYGPSDADLSLWNIGGELKAAGMAIDRALELGEPELIICHDLKNIQMWGDGLWKCNNPSSEGFRDKVMDAREQGLSITFGWVRGHNGNKFNELADKYADRGANGVIEDEWEEVRADEED